MGRCPPPRKLLGTNRNRAAPGGTAQAPDGTPGAQTQTLWAPQGPGLHADLHPEGPNGFVALGARDSRLQPHGPQVLGRTPCAAWPAPEGRRHRQLRVRRPLPGAPAAGASSWKRFRPSVPDSPPPGSRPPRSGYAADTQRPGPEDLSRARPPNTSRGAQHTAPPGRVWKTKPQVCVPRPSLQRC